MPAFATLILNKGADVDLLDEEGYTALMVAAGSAYGKSSLYTAAPYACIEIIVNAGATLTLTAPSGVTALGMYWRGKQESGSTEEVEEEERAKSVLEMIYAQQGAAPGSVTSLLAAEGATAMELLTRIVPEDQMRNQLLMIHVL